MKPGSAPFEDQSAHVGWLQQAIETWDAAVAGGGGSPGRGAVEVARTICKSINGA